MNNWFEVDREGLKKLQEGKSKTFIVRELIQNAWDEEIKECSIDINPCTLGSSPGIYVKVKDDSPEGFKDITHAYTLYSDTYKRRDVSKRGRFNLGDKQVFAMCERIKLVTTTKTIIFDSKGRTETDEKTKKGSVIELWAKGTPEEAAEMSKYAMGLLAPKGIRTRVNGTVLEPKFPEKTFQARLDTETEVNGIFSKAHRKTDVEIYEEEDSRLYELGIPVCEIDCQFSLNIMQKVPLGMDRETVSQSFLRMLYAHVLNNTYEMIEKEESSSNWIRTALKDKAIPIREAVESIMEKRFGDRSCVASPMDPSSMDDALSKGFNIIHGSEMSKEEWDNTRRFGVLKSSHELFGTEGFAKADPHEPSENDRIAAEYAKSIAKRAFKIDITVEFLRCKDARHAADYSKERKHLRFNMAKLGKSFFNPPVSEQTTDLIIHELGHEKGQHTEQEYHEALCKLGAGLTMLAWKMPDVFDGFNEGRSTK